MIGYLNSVFETKLDEYLNLISTKYGIKFSELKELLGEMNKKDATSTSSAVTVAVAPVQVKKPAIPSNENIKTCGYVYSRGLKKGSVCGSKAKKNCEFCSQHSTNQKKTDAVVVVETPTTIVKKPNPVLRMNKIISKWWHPDSGLVFKSAEEKIVIGIFKNEQLNDLTEEDIATCVSYKFKYVTKIKVVDDEFIKVNQTAKNVEVLIKEMFDTKPATTNDDDDEDNDVEEDVVHENVPWEDGGGVAESKENNEEEVVDEEEEEEEELLEEEPDEEDD